MNSTMNFMKTIFKTKIPSPFEIQSIIRRATSGKQEDVVRVAQLAFPEQKVTGLRNRILHNNILLEEVIKAAASGKVSLNQNIALSEITLGKEIGKGGSNSIVYLGVWRELQVAVKVFDTSYFQANDWEDYRKELALSAILEHKNIVQLYGGSIIPEEKKAVIVLEYCEKGDLNSYYKKNLSLKEKMSLLRGVANGMKYLKEVNVMHRDIKPHNVLIGSDGQAKLTDFGVSRAVPADNKRKTKYIGTPTYVAPEMFADNKDYSTEIDIFSFGVMMWQVVTEKTPYEGYGRFDLQPAKINGVRPAIPSTMDPKIEKIINACWNAVASKRPPAHKLVQALDKIITKLPKAEKSSGWNTFVNSCILNM